MRITWADVGYPDKRTVIPLADGELIIEQKHIDNWAINPRAAYEMSLGGVFEGVKKYVLGNWEIES